jgi:putative ABC transport system ATP-binding protein
MIKSSCLNAQVTLPDRSVLRTVNDVTVELRKEHSYAVLGKSGSGKTSLISIFGLLNRHYEGLLQFDGQDVSALSDKELAKIRASRIGFVFQNYSLMKQLSVWENVALPLQYGTNPKSSRRRKIAMAFLAEVGLEQRCDDRPSSLSGGEQQRVAIARALVADPDLVICDEPTGALDKQTGDKVMTVLMDLVVSHHKTLILVTHDPDIALICEHRLSMNEGRITPC